MVTPDHQLFEHELPLSSFHDRANRRVLGPLCEHKVGSLTKPPRLQFLLLRSTLIHSSNQVHRSFSGGLRYEDWNIYHSTEEETAWIHISMTTSSAIGKRNCISDSSFNFKRLGNFYIDSLVGHRDRDFHWQSTATKEPTKHGRM